MLRPAAPYEHVVRIGEDVEAGQVVLGAGARMRAQDLGGLAALGVCRISVRDRPRIAILSTGDEVVPPSGAQPGLGEVRDVNASTVAAVVERAGGIPVACGIVPDDEAALVARARDALSEADALVLSAGSSVSVRDMTARVVGRLGAPGVLVHGIALRPGKPTVLAVCDGKPVVGLPGNPTSALVVAWRLVRPMVRALGGERSVARFPGTGSMPAAILRGARLTIDVRSRPGREDYVPAQISEGAAGSLEATPLFAKSSLIFPMIGSDGLIAIPLDEAGARANSRVRVVIP